jgi:hypothetical protein
LNKDKPARGPRHKHRSRKNPPYPSLMVNGHFQVKRVGRRDPKRGKEKPPPMSETIQKWMEVATHVPFGHFPQIPRGIPHTSFPHMPSGLIMPQRGRDQFQNEEGRAGYKMDERPAADEGGKRAAQKFDHSKDLQMGRAFSIRRSLLKNHMPSIVSLLVVTKCKYYCLFTIF